MKQILLALPLGLALSLPAAAPLQAGPIGSACMASKRAAANPRLCNCIQQAADMTLTRGDQRLAARFFADPHRAQEIRQSDRRSHEVFWERYKQFGATAQAFCSA